MQDYVTPVSFAALLTVHAACLAALVAVLMSPAPQYPGWKLVGTSGTHWFCFIGAWAFGALISWIWLIVGSARADAEFQMRVAFWLAIVFCAGAAWCGWTIWAIRRMALRWRGDVIRWRAGRQDMQQAFTQFDAIRRGWDGMFQIRFKDQSVLKVDLYARNASDFLAGFSEALGRDVY